MMLHPTHELEHPANKGRFTNTTISGNSVFVREDENGTGGGIAVLGAGPLVLSNVTVVGNDADQGGGISGVPDYFASDITIEVGSSIVAQNANSDFLLDLTYAGVTLSSTGNNLIGNGDGAGGTFVDGVNGDIVGTTIAPVDPILGALGDNGGLTLSHLPQAGSPALDAGANPLGLTTDQRGLERAVDLIASNGVIDIGAVEVQEGEISADAPINVALYDADTDLQIAPLADGSTFLRSEISNGNLTIAALVSADSFLFNTAESMFLNFNDGESTRTENVEPYALFGDIGGDFKGDTLPIGENTISFEVYSGNKLQGDLLGIFDFSFIIIDDLG